MGEKRGRWEARREFLLCLSDGVCVCVTSALTMFWITKKRGWDHQQPIMKQQEKGPVSTHTHKPHWISLPCLQLWTAEGWLSHAAPMLNTDYRPSYCSSRKCWRRENTAPKSTTGIALRPGIELKSDPVRTHCNRTGFSRSELASKCQKQTLHL